VSAIVIADSASPSGARISTLEVRIHRFVLAEFNTHRKFSRNSASSRAIPYAKMRQRVLEDPAIPVSWPAEQKGMQGGAELEGRFAAAAREVWLAGRDYAVAQADNLVALGLHKSVVNRLLEPFMWHTIVVTATDWSGFFVQRCSPLAQPEIRVAAEAMMAALNDSKPTPLAYGEYHLPYLRDEDVHECFERKIDPRKVSSARCARVSYLTQDGTRDLALDVNLFERLASAKPYHASPMEHVARPYDLVRDDKERWTGNFDRWVQFRHELGMR
jgi:hypothetical protein